MAGGNRSIISGGQNQKIRKKKIITDVQFLCITNGMDGGKYKNFMRASRDNQEEMEPFETYKGKKYREKTTWERAPKRDVPKNKKIDLMWRPAYGKLLSKQEKKIREMVCLNHQKRSFKQVGGLFASTKTFNNRLNES